VKHPSDFNRFITEYVGGIGPILFCFFLDHDRLVLLTVRQKVQNFIKMSHSTIKPVKRNEAHIGVSLFCCAPKLRIAWLEVVAHLHKNQYSQASFCLQCLVFVLPWFDKIIRFRRRSGDIVYDFIPQLGFTVQIYLLDVDPFHKEWFTAVEAFTAL
jgi:hypothetical protein